MILLFFAILNFCSTKLLLDYEDIFQLFICGVIKSSEICPLKFNFNTPFLP